MDSTITSDLALLEELFVDNPDLERLESLLEQFNIFEAMGAVKVEKRHSDFLAFLLDPNQNHGLGDIFLKRLLQKAISSAQIETPIKPIHLDIMDLDDCIVQREWQNIDILLRDDINQLAVIIENKVGSSEHSDQLKRYRTNISVHYPAYRQLCLFLTPDGEEPSDSAYIAIDYGMMAGLVEALIESHGSVLGPDVRMIMAHYSQMLRRHIVSDSEIAELCRKIYRRHKQALDLIYEYLPDNQSGLRIFLEDLVSSEPTFELDYCTKSYVRFFPKTWDTPILKQGSGWTPTGRMLLLELYNGPDRLRLSLYIGPGPLEIRQKLMKMARNRPPFTPAKTLRKSWNTIYFRDWLKAKDYVDASSDDLEAKIKELWEQFLRQDFPMIQQSVQEQHWIWENTTNIVE